MKIIKSELLKLKTVKSTWIIAAIMLIAAIGDSFIAVHATNEKVVTGLTCWNGLVFLQTAEFCIAIIAILSITAEYTYSTILPSLECVSNRWKFLLGKTVTIGVLSYLFSIFCIFVRFCLTFIMAKMSKEIVMDQNFGQAFTTNGWITQLFVIPLGITLLALFALGLGFILRNSAGALGIYFAVILLLGSLIQSLGAVLNNEVMLDIPKILPTGLFETMVSNESAQVTTNGIGAGLLLNHSQSAIGLTIWAIVFLVVGGIMLKKKDA